jgi:hypothetical protein
VHIKYFLPAIYGRREIGDFVKRTAAHYFVIYGYAIALSLFPAIFKVKQSRQFQEHRLMFSALSSLRGRKKKEYNFNLIYHP